MALALLAARMLRQPPGLITLCFMWLVAGICVLVVVLNGSQVVSVWS